MDGSALCKNKHILTPERGAAMAEAKAKRLRKPDKIAKNETMSRKWDELVRSHHLGYSDKPVLTLLVHWYAVIDQCMAELTEDGVVSVSYQTEKGDEKARPQLAIMKQASAEIRALNKQLGIKDGQDVAGGETAGVRSNNGGAVSKLRLIQGRKAERGTGVA